MGLIRNRCTSRAEQKEVRDHCRSWTAGLPPKQGLQCLMLFFRQQPDEVFCHIVGEALDWMEHDLKDYITDPAAMVFLLPQTAKLITAGAVLATVEELRAALQSPEVYEIEPTHRLIIKEALQRYCELYNEGPLSTEVHGQYEIPKLYRDRMLALFLGEFTVVPKEKEEARTEAIQLCLLADAPWHSAILRDQSPWFKAGSAYPYMSHAT